LENCAALVDGEKMCAFARRAASLFTGTKKRLSL
jgi:hypothetical protein